MSLNYKLFYSVKINNNLKISNLYYSDILVFFRLIAIDNIFAKNKQTNKLLCNILYRVYKCCSKII